ncbi:SGNH/GDSL hydrolase family protein [Mucilaginibacter sp. McL0603]|uniref:SGNH/GDSL hydrolase family protein n=1 Tax=Mucilaginibacter sp. McL0603 TaxID=3415670 RepID=UPI003CED6F35
MKSFSCYSFTKAILAFFLLLSSLVQAQKIGSNVKRIVFLGNSITWQANYVNDVIAYLTVQYPNRHFDFINVGLPSETVSGLSEPGHAGGAFPRPDLHERLQRVLDQTKPDLVFASYGINDGIYMPFDTNRFQKFKDGINWLHNEVVKSGVQIIHIAPSVFDELRAGDAGYAAVIDDYASWLLGLHFSLKWEVIDVHFPMKKYLEAHRKVDAQFHLDGFALSSDGVHPNEVGHWIMAKQILLYLGCDEVANAPGAEQSLSKNKNGSKILKLITERENMLRDAWLTATGHKRPGMPVGLPLDEALKKSDEMGQAINTLVVDGAKY